MRRQSDDLIGISAGELDDRSPDDPALGERVGRGGPHRE